MFPNIFSRIQRSFASTLFISFFRPVTTVLLSSSESIHFVPAMRVFDSPIFFIFTLLKFFKGRLCLIYVWKCKFNVSQKPGIRFPYLPDFLWTNPIVIKTNAHFKGIPISKYPKNPNNIKNNVTTRQMNFLLKILKKNLSCL